MNKNISVKKGVVFSTLILVVVLVVIVTYSPSVPAKPAATWTPHQVYQYLEPGGEKSTTVTLSLDSSYKKKGPLSMSVTPSLEQYVSIDPNPTESPLQVLTVTFTVPESAQYQTIEGTLHLKSGKSTVAKPLPITLEVNQYGIPPDPGEAGKVTLEGIDSDNDGVRDDVQQWIGINAYPTESGRAALTQYAMAMQMMLLAEDDESVVAAAYVANDALQCLNAVRGDQRDAAELSDSLWAEQLNTIERSRKHIKSQSALSGKFFSFNIDEWLLKCDFDPWSMDVEARSQ